MKFKLVSDEERAMYHYCRIHLGFITYWICRIKDTFRNLIERLK